MTTEPTIADVLARLDEIDRVIGLELRAMGAEWRLEMAEIRQRVNALEVKAFGTGRATTRPVVVPLKPEPVNLPEPPKKPEGAKARDLYSVRQVAELLSISSHHVYRLTKTGELETVRLGRRVLVPAEFLRNYVNGLKP